METEKKKTSSKILNFFITTLNGMAYGLFATLIIGTIFASLAKLIGLDNIVGSSVNSAAACLQAMTGAGIGVGIALVLKFDPLKTIVLASVGQLAAYLSKTINAGKEIIVSNSFKIGDPLTIYIVVILTALLIKYILVKKTPVDILIVPLLGISFGLLLTMLIRTPMIYATYGIQYVIDRATTYQPFLMGIIISVIMGMALTAPISSAAIAAIVFTGEGSGLQIASGAAIIGCCTQMVGFAIMSRKDNKIGMVISVGIGTSMLQFKNIMRKPIIWLPTIIASAILGPIATCWLHVICMGSSAGMGTAGLVGQIGTFASMGGGYKTWLIVILFEIVAPLVLVFAIDLLFRKFHWIQDGDLKV